MVELIRTLRAPPLPVGAAARWGPLIRIHKVDREVRGSGISFTVYGDMQIAAGEFVLARELKLNTVQVLVLTAEPPGHMLHGYIPNKHIFNPGQYDNSASIDVFDDAATWLSPGLGPEDGSIWLNFIANGE